MGLESCPSYLGVEVYEILEGKFHVMHQNPKAIHEANKTIFLTFMSIVMAIPMVHATALLGFWFGENFVNL